MSMLRVDDDAVPFAARPFWMSGISAHRLGTVRVYCLTGATIDVDTRFQIALLRLPLFWAFIIAAYALQCFLVPPELDESAGLWGTLLFDACLFPLIFGSYFLLVFALAAVAKTLGVKRFPHVIISGLVIANVPVFDWMVAELLSVAWLPTVEGLVKTILLDLSCFELGTAFVAHMFAPRLWAQRDCQAGVAAPFPGPSWPAVALHPVVPAPSERVIPVGGDLVLASTILRIEAADHYVAVYSTDGSKRMVRQNIGPLVKLLPAQLGCMIHRSHWVSRDAADRMRTSAHLTELILKDGTRLPVARGRKAAVADWLAPPQRAPQHA